VSKSRTVGQTGPLAVATKALKMANYLHSLINVEYKYFDGDVVITPTYNGSLTNICAPTQGVSAIQREGDSILMKNVILTGQIAGGSNGAEVVRIVIFIDKEAVIGASGSALLKYAGSASVVRSTLNQDNMNDVVILYDESFAIDTYHPLQIFHVDVPIEMHQHFLATATTVRNNGLTVGVFSQFATNSPIFSYHSHTTYIDN